MSRKYDVYGIGNAIMDLQLQISESEFAQLGLERGTMRLVEADVQQELLNQFKNRFLNKTSGGSAANTMIALAQLGGSAAYGCLVGDDEFGGHYSAEMAELGITLHNAAIKQGRTGTCVVLITPDAERTMNTHLGASAGIDAGHVSKECIQHAEWLYVEGYLFATETGRRAARAGIDHAKRSGTKVALTFSDTFIVNAFHDEVTAAVQDAELLFANVNEAKAFVRTEDEERAFSELQQRCPNIVVTFSERGARYSARGNVQHIRATPVKAVDDTGAGDMFAGAFLHGMTHGYSPADATRLGCFLASKVVSQLGARLNGDVKELVGQGQWRTI